MLNISGTNNSICGDSIPDLPHFVNYASSTITSNGTFIECGGSTPGISYSQLCYYLGDDNEWHLAPVLPSGRRYGVLITLDNYLLYLGGYSSSGADDDIYKLEDDLNGSWSKVDDMLYGKRYHHCAVTIDSGVVIIGKLMNCLFICGQKTPALTTSEDEGNLETLSVNCYLDQIKFVEPD